MLNKLLIYDRWKNFDEFDLPIAAMLWADLEHELIKTLLYLNPGQSYLLTPEKLARLLNTTDINDILDKNKSFKTPVFMVIFNELELTVAHKNEPRTVLTPWREKPNPAYEYSRNPFAPKTVLVHRHRFKKIAREELLAIAEITGEKPAFLFP